MSEIPAIPTPPEPAPIVVRPTAVAGWYPDPDVSGGQRYWDGSMWTEHRHSPIAGAAPLAPYAQVAPRPKNGPAIAALVLGIVGMLIGLWGLIPAAALIFGIVGYQTSARLPDPRGPGKFVGRAFSIWGIVLGAIGIVYAILAIALRW